MTLTYSKFLLSLRGHETFLRLLCLGGLFHASPHFGPFAFNFGLFPLLFLLFLLTRLSD